MIFSTERLVDEYYKSVREQYPDIDFDTFAKICRAPFHYFRKKMEDMTFPLIQVKYFGKFIVYPGKVESIINAITRRKEKGNMTEEEYQEAIIPLKNYLDNYEEIPDTDD